MSGERRPETGEHSDSRSPTRTEWPERLAESVALAQDAEARRHAMLAALADAWRAVELHGALLEAPRFAALCDAVQAVRIPPLLLYEAVLDVARSPARARRFERLGYRIEDDDERWETANDLAGILREVLPDARVRSRSEAGGRTDYVVVTGIVGPGHLRGELTTVWSAGPDVPPTLRDVDVSISSEGSDGSDGSEERLGSVDAVQVDHDVVRPPQGGVH